MPGDKNGNSVWIQDLTLIPGFAAREHSHSGTEYLVVERGTATVTIKGQAPKTLQVGAAIVIPANVPHHIANLSKTDALDVIGFKVGSKKSWYLNLDKRTQVACRPPVKP